MNDKNHDHEEDDIEDDEAREIIVYTLDPQTHDLIEIACNCIVNLADAQVNEESAQGLIAIADSLAERFNIGRLDQEIHKNDDGEEEVIFRPSQNLFPEEPDEGEAPAAKP